MLRKLGAWAVVRADMHSWAVIFLASSVAFNWGEGKHRCHVRCNGLAPMMKEACTSGRDPQYDRVLVTIYIYTMQLLRPRFEARARTLNLPVVTGILLNTVTSASVR